MDIAYERSQRPGARSCAGLALAVTLLVLSIAGAGLARATEGAVSFAAAGDAVKTHTLANGLQIIVWPDHRIPSVTLYNWVRVGSRNEGRAPPGWRTSSST